MTNVQRAASLLVGLAWVVVCNSGFGAESTLAASNAGPVPSGLRNVGFEESTTAWTLKPATDFAEIAVTDDLTAPEETKGRFYRDRSCRVGKVC